MIVYGSEISIDIKNEIREELLKLEGKRKPKLSVVLVGNNPASLSYVKGKEKACTEVGFLSEVIHLDENISEIDLISKIEELNDDENVDGILVQLPLPKHLSEDNVINHIRYDKDVDGLTPINAGKLFLKQDGLVPCTPLGVIEILKRSNVSIASKNVVVIGRSKLVGLPVAKLLLDENATVTITHSKTNNLKDVCKKADILIVAIGKAKFINSEFIKDGAVVIDVGINRVDNKLVGDVDFDDVVDKVSLITPVPKGVGPMTIAMLLLNTLKAYRMHYDRV